MFTVYILECADGSLYVGHTDDFDLRMQQQHDACIDGYTATRRPLKVLHTEVFGTRYEALTSERKLKGWSRAKKARLYPRRLGRRSPAGEAAAQALRLRPLTRAALSANGGQGKARTVSHRIANTAFALAAGPKGWSRRALSRGAFRLRSLRELRSTRTEVEIHRESFRAAFNLPVRPERRPEGPESKGPVARGVSTGPVPRRASASRNRQGLRERSRSSP